MQRYLLPATTLATLALLLAIALALAAPSPAPDYPYLGKGDCLCHNAKRLWQFDKWVRHVG